MRLLGRAIAHAGDEGPVELGKLETLYQAVKQARGAVRRTLAGAVITLAASGLSSNGRRRAAAGALAAAGNRRFTK